MIGSVAGRLPLLAAVAVAFAVSFAAASQLVVSAIPAPAAASGDAATCQQDQIVVGYTLVESTVRTLDLSGLDPDCNGKATLTVSMGATYLVDASTGARATTYVHDMTSGTVLSIALEDADTGVAGIPIEDYSTGTISLAVLPKAGVTEPW